MNFFGLAGEEPPAKPRALVDDDALREAEVNARVDEKLMRALNAERERLRSDQDAVGR